MNKTHNTRSTAGPQELLCGRALPFFAASPHIRTLGPLDYRRVSYLRLAMVVRAGLAAVLVAMAVGGNRRRVAEEC